MWYSMLNIWCILYSAHGTHDTGYTAYSSHIWCTLTTCHVSYHVRGITQYFTSLVQESSRILRHTFPSSILSKLSRASACRTVPWVSTRPFILPPIPPSIRFTKICQWEKLTRYRQSIVALGILLKGTSAHFVCLHFACSCVLVRDRHFRSFTFLTYI